MSVRDDMAAECARIGTPAFAAGCLRLLAGGDPHDAPELVRSLAGERHVGRVLSGHARADMSHWTRVWAGRGLLWHWDPGATGGVVAGLGDEQWRVREMCAKVLGRHLVGDALPALAALRDDPVQRVRLAADRAVARIVAARG